MERLRRLSIAGGVLIAGYVGAMPFAHPPRPEVAQVDEGLLPLIGGGDEQPLHILDPHQAPRPVIEDHAARPAETTSLPVIAPTPGAAALPFSSEPPMLVSEGPLSWPADVPQAPPLTPAPPREAGLSPYAEAEIVRRVAPHAPSEPPPAVEVRRYRVRDGDTLRKLAERYWKDGSRYLELYELNRGVLPSPEILPIGAELIIPLVP